MFHKKIKQTSSREHRTIEWKYPNKILIQNNNCNDNNNVGDTLCHIRELDRDVMRDIGSNKRMRLTSCVFVSDCGEYIQNFEYSNILLTFLRINFSYTKIFGHLFMSVLECKK